MEVFATFDIIDSNGNKVAEGHKASFCLEDNQCMPGVQPRWESWWRVINHTFLFPMTHNLYI